MVACSLIQTFTLLLGTAVHCAASGPLASNAQSGAIREDKNELVNERRLTKLYVLVTGKPVEDVATKLFVSTVNGQIHLDKICVKGDNVLIDDGSRPPFGIHLARNDFSKLLNLFTSTGVEQILGAGDRSLKYMLQLLSGATNILVNPFVLTFAMIRFRRNLGAALNKSDTEGFGSVESLEDVPGLTKTSLRTILDIYTGMDDKMRYFANQAYSADADDDSLTIHNSCKANTSRYFTVLLHLIRLFKITELNLRGCMLNEPLSEEAQDILASCQIARVVPPHAKIFQSRLYLTPDCDASIRNRVWHKLTEVGWFSKRGDRLLECELDGIFKIRQNKFCRGLIRPAIKPEDFSALEMLDIYTTRFPADKMKYLEKAVKLRVLNIANCHNIPSFDFLKNMTKLETLWLLNNNLSKMPGGIFARLPNLSSLKISHNPLRKLPREIGQLKELTMLIVTNNKFLTAIPSTLSSCSKLSFLNIYNSNLQSLPDRLNNLVTLNISNSHNPELLATVAKYKSLETLNIENNMLSALPPDFSNLKNLRVLGLRYNRIHTVPEVIAGLPLLRELDLSHNRLSTLSCAVAGLRYLHTLDLDENKLRRMPRFVMNMKKHARLSNLHLSDNPLQNDDRHDLLGLRTLWKVFGKCVMPEYEYLERIAQNKKKEKKAFYSDMNSMPLHWDLKSLRRLRLAAPLPSESPRVNLEETWAQILGNPVFCGSNELLDKKQLNGLLEVLRSPKLHLLRGYDISATTKAVMKDYLEAVTLNIQARIEQGDTDRAIAIISQVNDSLTACPSGQLAALTEIYKIHCLNQDPDDFVGFVKEFIAKTKEDKFTATLALPDHPQNVHLLLYWKQQLKDALGLVLEYGDSFGRVGQDEFGDNTVAVLRAFFSRFSPKNIASALAGEINRTGRVAPAWLYLMGAGKAPVEKSKALFVVEGEEASPSYGFPYTLREAGAEEILVRVGVLVRRTPTISRRVLMLLLDTLAGILG